MRELLHDEVHLGETAVPRDAIIAEFRKHTDAVPDIHWEVQDHDDEMATSVGTWGPVDSGIGSVFNSALAAKGEGSLREFNNLGVSQPTSSAVKWSISTDRTCW